MGGTFGVTVFNRIVMDIVQMLAKVFFVSNCVFPEAPLPYGRLPFFSSGGITVRFGSTLGQISFGKQSFEHVPSGGKVGVAIWQSPNAMQMIREEAENFRSEWKAILRPFPGRS